MPSIKNALAEAVKQLQRNSDTPLLEAEILLCKILENDRAYLRTWPEQEISDKQTQEFTDLIAKRQLGEPVAYLIGKREFWSREFIVTPDVLIPRPETELLVELSLNLIPQDKSFKILDLGTGSGIIALTLALERPQAKVIATDISPAALAIAKANTAKHQANNIQFYQSDWFDSLPESKFDLIVSNPPYVAEGDPHLQAGDLRFEPTTALVSAENGLADIRIIAENAINRLNNNGFLLLEHGYNQHKVIKNLLNSFGYRHVETYKDLSGQARVTSGRC